MSDNNNDDGFHKEWRIQIRVETIIVVVAALLGLLILSAVASVII